VLWDCTACRIWISQNDPIKQLNPNLFLWTSSSHQHRLVSCCRLLGKWRMGGCRLAAGLLHPGYRAHLWAAVLASSTPPPCIQLRTVFMPPSGSSFRLLPLRWMLSWIPNMSKASVSRGVSVSVHLFSWGSFARLQEDATWSPEVQVN